MNNALISDCGEYRYWLTREFENELNFIPCGVVFIMLNPSTADADKDDATIRRCISFAKGFGFNSLVVVNAYGYRATKPVDLWKVSEPVGPDNDEWIKRIVSDHETVIVAWGGNAKINRIKHVHRLLKQTPTKIMCLGTTKNGDPRHPLYVKSSQILTPWELNHE